MVVKEIIEKAWKLSHSIQVQRIDRNIFLFTFGHEVDRQLAFNRRPWTIKGAHLILKPWTPDLSWHEMDFSTSTLWVQIHGLPILWQMKDNINRIALWIGRIIDVDFTDEPKPHWKKFVRVRVEVDITIPLKSGMFLPRPGLPNLWIGLKYKKLFDLCYKYDSFGHVEKDCGHPKMLLSNKYGIKFPAFGDWHRTEYEKQPPDI